jgi:hypothetical protein
MPKEPHDGIMMSMANEAAILALPASIHPAWGSLANWPWHRNTSTWQSTRRGELNLEGATSTTAAFMQKWFGLTKESGTNEVWDLVEQ